MKVIEVPCTKIQFSVSFAGAFRFVYIERERKEKKEKERKSLKKKKNQQIKRETSEIGWKSMKKGKSCVRERRKKMIVSQRGQKEKSTDHSNTKYV